VAAGDVAVGIVEDHPVFRSGLTAVFTASPGWALTHVAIRVEDFLAKTPPVPTVVLLDLHLPGLSGPRGVAAVAETGAHVLVLSATGTRDAIVDAIGAGAAGYLVKHAEPEEILRATGIVAHGGTYVSPTLASFLLDTFTATPGAGGLDLSPREAEVLSLVASGERDRDIAEQLNISVATVRSHLDRIRDKTGRRRRSDLTRFAIDSGLLRGDEARSD
jgi:DNA-binding NarL/FixJ family response regulator